MTNDKIRLQTRCHATLMTDDLQAKRAACEKKSGHKGPHTIRIIYTWYSRKGAKAR